MKAFKDANKLYAGSDCRAAADKYEEALQLDPDATATCYFYLGNSYDNLYRPTRKGEPTNDAYLEKAIANYKLGSEKANTPIVKQRSLQYLVNAYGPEKLNDPTQAEPVVQGDDRARAERADQLLRARRHLRRLRRIRAGRADLPEGQGSAGPTTRRCTCSWRASTTARATSTRRSTRSPSAPRSSRTTPRRTRRSRPTTGTRRIATSA